MKRLSYWALMNPWKSQTILVCCHLLVAALAIYTGVLLFSYDIIVPTSVLYAGEALFFTLLICYPIRRARHKFWKTNFVRQKLMDVGFVLSYILMAVTITNTDARLAASETDDAPFTTAIVLKENAKPAPIDAPKSAVLSRKEIRKQFKSWVLSMKSEAKTDKSTRRAVNGIIFLMIILMLAIAALACSISCSNSSGWAILVLLGGWAIILLLGIGAIRKIKGKKAANYQPMPNG